MQVNAGSDNNIALVESILNQFLSTPVAARAVRLQLEIVPQKDLKTLSLNIVQADIKSSLMNHAWAV